MDIGRVFSSSVSYGQGFFLSFSVNLRQVFSYGVNLGHVFAVLISFFLLCYFRHVFYSVNNLGAEFLSACVNQVLLNFFFLGGGGQC